LRSQRRILRPCTVLRWLSPSTSPSPEKP
jgi:hypothetical protein